MTSKYGGVRQALRATLDLDEVYLYKQLSIAEGLKADESDWKSQGPDFDAVQAAANSDSASRAVLESAVLHEIAKASARDFAQLRALRLVLTLGPDSVGLSDMRSFWYPKGVPSSTSERAVTQGRGVPESWAHSLVCLLAERGFHCEFHTPTGADTLGRLACVVLISWEHASAPA